MYRCLTRSSSPLKWNNQLPRRLLSPLCVRASVLQPIRTASTDVNAHSQTKTEAVEPVTREYEGPLAGAYTRLKIFSLSSLGLATMITPFMFVIDSTISTGGRAFLGITAMATSTISTALVAWAGSSYVTRLKVDENGKHLHFTTTNLFLRPIKTTVYDPMFLEAAEYYFTKVRLRKNIRIPMKDVERLNMGLMDGLEETVAESMDSKGNVKGWWAVKWRREGDAGYVGECAPSGKFMRGFNIGPEVLRKYLQGP